MVDKAIREYYGLSPAGLRKKEEKQKKESSTVETVNKIPG
jgi:hypothetical protein